MNYKIDTLTNFFPGPVSVGVYIIAVEFLKDYDSSHSASTVIFSRLAKLFNDPEYKFHELTSRIVIALTLYSVYLFFLLSILLLTYFLVRNILMPHRLFQFCYLGLFFYRDLAYYPIILQLVENLKNLYIAGIIFL